MDELEDKEPLWPYTAFSITPGNSGSSPACSQCYITSITAIAVTNTTLRGSKDRPFCWPGFQPLTPKLTSPLESKSSLGCWLCGQLQSNWQF